MKMSKFHLAEHPLFCCALSVCLKVIDESENRHNIPPFPKLAHDSSSIIIRSHNSCHGCLTLPDLLARASLTTKKEGIFRNEMIGRHSILQSISFSLKTFQPFQTALYFLEEVFDDNSGRYICL